ncbi:MAG: DUF554 domain-containing protein [Clostridia bacterium]|nr:DUF554 domain-containing protein [Clostridia bacterium]
MIGIISDFFGIFIGCILGDLFFAKRKLSDTFSAICGIIISMLSIVGFITSSITVSKNGLESPNIIFTVICIVIGTLIGECLDLETRIYNSKILESPAGTDEITSAVITGTIMFAVGGMAIVGPLDAFLTGDNSTLFIKAFIDFSISLSLGGALGKKVAISALPVTVLQLIIGVFGLSLSSFFTDNVIDSICCVGYVILFFSGFNFIFDKIIKIKTVNMLPAIALVILCNVALYFIKLTGLYSFVGGLL